MICKGPDFQAPPMSDFDRAASKKDMLTATFASQTARFIDPTKINASREVYKIYDLVLLLLFHFLLAVLFVMF